MNPKLIEMKLANKVELARMKMEDAIDDYSSAKNEYYDYITR